MKTIICSKCGASFVPQDDIQKATMTCPACFKQITNCLPEKDFVYYCSHCREYLPAHKISNKICSKCGSVVYKVNIYRGKRWKKKSKK